MGALSGRTPRLVSQVVAVLALSDLAYRLFVREPLRRALGIEVRHAA
jgi:hypothetical protein